MKFKKPESVVRGTDIELRFVGGAVMLYNNKSDQLVGTISFNLLEEGLRAHSSLLKQHDKKIEQSQYIESIVRK